MIASAAPTNEFFELMCLLTEDRISEPQADRLEELLWADPANRAYYVEFKLIVAGLHRSKGSGGTQTCLPVIKQESEENELYNIQPIAPSPRAPTFLSNITHGASSYFPTEWLVSYSIATVIFAVAALIGANTYVKHYTQVAYDSASIGTSNPQSPIPNPSPDVEFVARITGMVDCQWAKKGTDPVYSKSPEGVLHKRGLSPFSPEGHGTGDGKLASGQGPRDQTLPSPSGRGAGGEGSENVASGQSSVAGSPQIPKSRNPEIPSSPFLALGDTLSLSSGLMEITYNTGAKVILQGPVTYKVDSNGGFLSIGKLTGKLEKVANKSEIPKSQNPQIPNPSLPTTHYPLFTIKTPTAIVTDLGTEFGVEVDEQGLTTSHVFRGLVRVQGLADGGKTEGAGQLLHENESVRVERSGQCRIVVVSAAQSAGFVRAIPKPKMSKIKTLDLVDVVAGGDGFSGRRNAGINPTNGRVTDIPPLFDEFFLSGDKTYHRTTELRLVDGVFIPASGKEPTEVDSAGHTFAGWENITGNQTYGYIWAGGKVPAAPGVTLGTQLGEIDYATPGRGLIFLHANSGITFDLDAIRRANPGQRLMQFRAMTGNAETYSTTSDMVSIRHDTAMADVLVLIDGHLRFRRREINGCSGVLPVEIPLADTDRFLTLIGADSGNGLNWDWIVFGDPQLEMKSWSHP